MPVRIRRTDTPGILKKLSKNFDPTLHARNSESTV